MAKKEDKHAIQCLYEDGLKAQRRASHEYWLNSAFLRGNQWVHFNTNSRRLEQVPRTRSGRRVCATINRLWPGSRTIISKLVQRPLVFEVQANSADDTAIEGAKVGDSILSAIKDEHRWEELRESIAWSAWKGGTAAICVDWDPSKGKPTALADDGRKLPSGDTVETALSIAEFVIQPGAPVAETADWWIKAQALPPSVVKGQWGLSEDPPATATAGLSTLERSLMSPGAGPGSDASVEHTPLTLVLTYYERPNPNCKKGKIEVIVDNKTVWGPKDWPFPFVDYLNIDFLRETLIENDWKGETALSAARPIQAAVNRAWSNILEHIDTVGAAKLLRPQSSIELQEQYTDIIGEQIPYMDGQSEPKYMSPPQLPQWILNSPTELILQIDDILGVHDVSRGSAPANIESGYGLAVLAEQDATPIGKLNSGTARLFSRVGSKVLKIYEQEVKETRSAVIQSPGEPPDTVPWTGKTIAGQTTARVPQELIAPRSHAALMQTADKLLEMGVITSLEEWSRVAEMPDERSLIAAVRPDVARARRENVSMAQGKVCFPEDFDAHEIHFAEHDSYRKTARYEALPAEFKEIFAAHLDAHRTLMAEAAGRQQGAMNAAGPPAAAAAALGGPEVPLLPVDPNAPPPLEDQTVMDQLTGSISGAVDREDAEASAEGAAVDQQEAERDAILQMAAIAEGRP